MTAGRSRTGEKPSLTPEKRGPLIAGLRKGGCGPLIELRNGEHAQQGSRLKQRRGCGAVFIRLPGRDDDAVPSALRLILLAVIFPDILVKILLGKHHQHLLDQQYFERDKQGRNIHDRPRKLLPLFHLV